jgi:hypothetical protein
LAGDLSHDSVHDGFRRASAALAAWTPAAALVIGGTFAAAAVEFAPVDSTRLVAVFPPWWSAERALAAAGEVAAVSGVGAVGFAVAVAADRPGLTQALRDRGAFWVLDARAVPACFSSLEKAQRR